MTDQIMTDADVIAALSDTNVVALTLYGETRNEPIEGIVAVGCVIRNRVATKYRGQTYREVCLANWQFSCWKPEGGKANYDKVLQLARLIVGGWADYDRAFGECQYVAAGIIDGHFRDRVGKSRHYHTKAMNPKPKWAIGKTPAFTINAHVFYEGIA